MANELNKSILLANSSGAGKAYSPEELMLLRLNHWTGWSCAAGFDHIQIDPEGVIKAAACNMQSFYGNVYEGPVEFAKSWLKCEIKWCMCGTDMRLRKIKNVELLSTIEDQMSTKRKFEPLKQAEDAEWVGPLFWDHFLRHPKSVSWDISRRCNFSCSYCHPSISNKTDRLRTREELFGAVFRIMRGFANGKRISWMIAGGEPTLHDCYLELVEMLYRKQHIVHTQTNGSRLPSYYAELIRWSNIGISVHLEFADQKKLVEVARAIVEKKESDSQSAMNWFGVRIMVGPGKLDQALKLSNELEKLSLFKKHGLVFMSTLYERNERDKLMKYDEAELSNILMRS